jgi:hypothetical protein
MRQEMIVKDVVSWLFSLCTSANWPERFDPPMDNNGVVYVMV